MSSLAVVGSLLMALFVNPSRLDRLCDSPCSPRWTFPALLWPQPVKVKKSTNPLLSPLAHLLLELAYDLAKEHGPELLKELNDWIRPAPGTAPGAVEKPYGRLRADRDKVGEWEMFRLYVNEDKTLSFAGHTGFLSAESGGGGIAIANRKTIGEWERWNLIDLQDGKKFGLRSKSGHYLCVNEDGKKVTVDREGLGKWETFTLVHDEAKKTCSFLCWNGKYLSSQP